jgi:hypothetical protein
VNCEYSKALVCVHCGHRAQRMPTYRRCPAQGTDAQGILQKAKNFASAAASHVAAGMPMASDEEIIRRHDICRQCEHLVNDACNLCGCPVSRVAGYVSKLSWADQECPAGKWGTAPSA